ncbi:hypothetical protein NIES932_14490 [Raphidiopsis curvata NIES-932]|nr:hypothetical protein NIES932_14490 [Raphidiopsis curvata NIES-932]
MLFYKLREYFSVSILLRVAIAKHSLREIALGREIKPKGGYRIGENRGKRSGEY